MKSCKDPEASLPKTSLGKIFMYLNLRHMADTEEIVVCASGYFDCLTIGHIEYLARARALGDKLIVIVNNDDQAKLKKGFSFMSIDERVKIIAALKSVDEVFVSVDKDRTVCKSLEVLRPNIFAKGGDTSVSVGNIPEKGVCDAHNIRIVDGLGDKIQSSRWLLRELKIKLGKVSDDYLNAEM